MIEIHAATDLTHLVLQAFAFMDIRGPDNWYDLHYQKWSRKNLPLGAWQNAQAEASLLSVLYDRADGASLLQSFARLHHDIEHFRASARYPIETLTSEDVDDYQLLDRVRAIDRTLVEIFRASLAELSRDFRPAFADVMAPAVQAAVESCTPMLARAAAVMPELERCQVELAFPAGSRVRKHGCWFLVGAPAEWNSLHPATLAIVVLHAMAVELAQRRGRAHNPEVAAARSQVRALANLAANIERGGTTLVDAHRDWLAELDLEDILERAGSLVGKKRARQIIDRPHQRVEVFREMIA